MKNAINKGRRNELKNLKFITRLKNYGLTGATGNVYAFKTTGKPCSCYLCSTSKYKQNGLKKLEFKEVKFQMENAAMAGGIGLSRG